MIAPDAFVRHVHAFFAFAGGSGDNAVGVYKRLAQELRRLLPPDLQANLVDDLL